MEKEARKATDVLLELESKIDILLSIVRNQDLNIKLLSNKLNSLLEKASVENNKIIVEAVNNITQTTSEKSIPISSENRILVDTNPQGFRRTSRPETFSGDNTYLSKSDPNATVTFPMQIPKMPAAAEVVVPEQATSVVKNKKENFKNKEAPTTDSFPVVQRIVDKNGKSVFLADVEIINVTDNSSVAKTRTNGTGKWMTSLPVGQYKVFVRKRESLSKEKVEVAQDIQIDGTASTVELQTMILRI